MGSRRRLCSATGIGAVLLLACGPSEPLLTAFRWQVLTEGAASALLSVNGTAADDVWMVGADAGHGPPVLHYDGVAWAALDSGARADLWWVTALPDGSVHMGGSNATVLAYRDGVFQRMQTPGLAKHTVFGVWAAAASDVYAVGSIAGRNGFIWHYDGVSFGAVSTSQVDWPRDQNGNTPGLLKVWGATASDVWIVGDEGLVLRGNARDGFTRVESGTIERLFTVAGAAGRVVMVGGSANGVALEARSDPSLVPITPPGASVLQGVSISPTGAVWTVGLGGNIYELDPDRDVEWQATLTDTPVQSLHSVWVDPLGSVWTVGGNVLVDSLDGGVALRGSSGSDVAQVPLPPPALPEPPRCPAGELDPAPAASIARRWNEQLLGAIRRDQPRAMVQARNAFHVSVAMWDAWAAYDERADGYVASERASAEDVQVARREAISYAAFRVLERRFAAAAGGAVSEACFVGFMKLLGYDPLDRTSTGDTPHALGNRIGERVLEQFASDGANEGGDYADPTGISDDSPPLSADLPGTTAIDPLRWQPLSLSNAVSLNGIPLGSGVQRHAGSHWGTVTPFALVRPLLDEAYLDVGAPPTRDDPTLIAAVVSVIQQSGMLSIEDGMRLDVSPAAMGNHSLGTDDGSGRAMNPVTGQPYEPRLSLRGDVARALVAYWENGPHAETPPGHWNVLANAVSDDPRLERRPFGTAGDAADPLAWDVKLYFMLNGALHDAAIATWEQKLRHPSARPITLVRYFASQPRSYPDLPGLQSTGLPLVPGSIELITQETSAPGERHAGLESEGETWAVRAWPGEPGDRERQTAGVRWIPGRDWVPFQPRAFVSPPYPGYVAEQAAFGRAAAEVLSSFTGSEFFPGGLGHARVEPGALRMEAGPSEAVELEWATYADAADQAGQSCTWAGTQFSFDDFAGRRLGVRVGRGAAVLAARYFDGSARP